MITITTTASQNTKPILQMKNVATKSQKAKTTAITGFEFSFTKDQRNQIVVAHHHLLDAMSEDSDSESANEEEQKKNQGWIQHTTGHNVGNHC